MAIQTSYPGVYIEEFAPAAPIEGVGTSTAAFIGVAAAGALDTPTKLTSWDQFRAVFGEQPAPGFHLWYAVRGFFENGGQVCYVVRASNGDYDRATLLDRETPSAAEIIRLQARQPGSPATPITVTVAEAHALAAAGTSVYKPTATVASIASSKRELTVAAGEARFFRAGDRVRVSDASNVEESLVTRITGDVLRLDTPLGATYASPIAVRLADAAVGTRTVRLVATAPPPAGVLTAGTVLSVNPGGAADVHVVDSVQTEHLGAGETSYRVTFRDGLKSSVSMDPGTATAVQSEEFDLTVTQGAGYTYAGLGVDPAHPRYFLNVLNDHAAGLVRASLVEPPPAAALPDSLPAAQGPVTLSGGQDESLADLADPDPAHDIDFLDALDTLSAIDDVNMVAVPDRITGGFQTALITRCEQLADRFAVLDAAAGAPPFGADSVETQRAGLDSTRGYAALYYPWLRVAPVGPGQPILVPPSGHVCGIIARSDLSRGVHKAPANEIVNGALGVELSMSDVDQGQLNLEGVNVVRVFSSGGRPVLWGARTTATDKNWQYVNIRRLFLFLEESIQEGIRGAVFEPNNPGLWARLGRTLTEFLTRVWRDGALFGNTAKEAFYVRIDETLNPDSSRALGRLYVEIGVRPSYPAEFIVVRIGIWQGGSQVSES